MNDGVAEKVIGGGGERQDAEKVEHRAANKGNDWAANEGSAGSAKEAE